MNLSPEHLPLAILLTLFTAAMVVSRLWLRRHRNTAKARYRLLSISLPLLALALVGLLFTKRSEPRNWAGVGLLSLSIVFVERTRARLRKEVGNTDHDA